jgi:hypothetical protein
MSKCDHSLRVSCRSSPVPQATELRCAPDFGDAHRNDLRFPYLPSTTSIPESTRPSFVRGKLPARSVSSVLSKLTICETLATDSFGRPVNRVESTTLPGTRPHLVLLVSGTQTTVAMRLRFNESPCTTTTGLRNPGPDPIGSGSSAPPDISLGDHHSLRSSNRRDAADTNGSGSEPISEQT